MNWKFWKKEKQWRPLDYNTYIKKGITDVLEAGKTEYMIRHTPVLDMQLYPTPYCCFIKTLGVNNKPLEWKKTMTWDDSYITVTFEEPTKMPFRLDWGVK